MYKRQFHYSPETPVCKGIDLRISQGETVALVGSTGAGKTSIASLLMRLYDVTGGKITIDGHDIREVSLSSLARQFGVVPQEPYLFSATSVADNIRYNRRDLSDETIVGAAKTVGAHDFISDLPQGYETEMQERGGNLSMGQRQLISFARAVARDPRILILDEATANVDTESEKMIQGALDKLLNDRTAIVIAHRLSTIRGADKIVVVNDGGVEEEGTDEELTALNGTYAKLTATTVAV